ncbi:MAG: transglutaminase domain-containing protein [Deltaproteobacteria bacterium]|nr:transglutaminase domain-containing protein [Deltaproteobacteria bacterium]
MKRVAAALPVLAAFAVHAAAHDRWLVTGPAAAIVLLATIVGWRVPHRAGWLLFALIAGAALGLALHGFAPTPPGPVPPPLLSPLCTALLGCSVFCALSDRRGFALVYAWLLAVLSTNVDLSPALAIALGLLALSTLGALLAEAGALTSGVTAVGFAGFAALALGAAWPLALGLRASEGILMETLIRLSEGGGTQHRTSVDLPAATHVPISDEAVLDLDGDPPRYLRTGVLEVFDGRRWTAAERRKNERLTLPGGDGARLELTFLTAGDDLVPAPAGVLAVSGAATQTRGGWIVGGADLGGLTLTLARGEERLPAEPSPAPIALPDELAAELRPLADELLGAERSTRAQAETLEQYFAASFTYSLDVDLYGKGHPLAVLIREKRPAFCTYFASAMVALLSVRGVPARLVTGFAPAERNALTGRTVVRARDAHAWVEVYLDDRYVAFDPTPFRSRDDALGVQRSRGAWRDAFGALAAFFGRAFAAMRHRPAAVLLAVMRSPFVYAFVALLAIVAIIQRRRQRGVRLVVTRAMDTKDPAFLRAYAEYAGHLRRLGFQRAAAETDAELIARLHTAGHDRVASAATDFVTAFQRARFRGDALQCDAALAAVKEAARGSIGGAGRL